MKHFKRDILEPFQKATKYIISSRTKIFINEFQNFGFFTAEDFEPYYLELEQWGQKTLVRKCHKVSDRKNNRARRESNFPRVFDPQSESEALGYDSDNDSSRP